MTAGLFDRRCAGDLTVWFADGGVFQHFGHFAARKRLKSAGGHGPRHPVLRTNAVRVLWVVLRHEEQVQLPMRRVRQRQDLRQPLGRATRVAAVAVTRSHQV